MKTLFDRAALPAALPPSRNLRPIPSYDRSVPWQWPLDDAVTVVLFAGLGGACQGLEEAGLPVHVANNHDDVAIAAHAALNPHTKHIRGDIFDVDPIEATGGRQVKVLWASPDCRDHSVAKGGAPRSARVRSLPWQVCRWAGKTRPKVIFIENVKEIRGWGPLIAKRCPKTGRVLKLDGSVAAKGERVPRDQQQLVRDKARLGRSFRRFVAHLRSLGYAYEDRDLCCADYGVPTSRRRWFAVARRDGRPIRWPERTHAPRDEAAARGLLPWVPAADIIDWSLPLPSIFERKKPLADATMRRIATGLKRFVIDNPTPFIIPLTHHGEGRVYPVAETLRTITSAHRGELAVVAPLIAGAGGRAAQVPPMNLTEPLNTSTTKEDRVLVGPTLVQTGYGERAGQAPRALDITAPIGTQVAGGGKHAVVGAWMAQHNTGVVGHCADDALSTLTTTGSHQQLAAVHLTEFRGTSKDGQAVTDPAPTVCTGGGRGGGHAGVVAAFLAKYYGTGGQDQDCRDALHTLSTRDRFGVVTVTIAGQPFAVTDIGMRMLEPHEAAAAHELTLPKLITVAGKTRPLTKTEAMRLVGNSVPKRMARLLAAANSVHALQSPSVQAAE